MGARHKLNEIFIGGSAFLAALFGLAAQSWSVFGLVLLGLLAIHVVSGSIRLPPR